MGDEKDQRDRARSRVKAGEDFEVQHVAEETGITTEQARTLIRRHGTDRVRIREEAKLIRGS